jgi:pectate lyase
VTTLAALQNAVKGTSAAVIHVKGKLAPGKIDVGSNKTIIGLCDAEIHGSLRFSASVNVIVRNVTVVGFGAGDCSLDPDFDSSVGCSSGNDAVGVNKNSHHIWFDHCEVRDGTDGNLDITNGSDNVTVSWTLFTYSSRTDNVGDDSTGSAGHRFSSLVGGTDNPSYDDANTLNVTWHHNRWTNGAVERMPRVRFGRNHLFNNLFDSSTSNYCVRAGKGARILLQNNTFDGVKSPHQFNNSTDENTAYISSSGNAYISVSGDQETGGGGTAWTSPSYSYTAETAAASSAAVKAGVGPQ